MENKFNEGLEAKAANFDRCYGFAHVIKRGDTLYKLSRQYNVKVSALILANPYVNIYNLQVGDTLCIPRIRPIVVPVPPYPPTSVRPRMPEEMRPPTQNQPRMPEEMRSPMQGQPPIPEEEMPTENMDPEMRMVRPEAVVMPGNEENQTAFDMPEIPVVSEEISEEMSEEIEEQKAEIAAEEQGVPEWADLKSRIDTMTVQELLDEWDITYPMLTTCLDIIKKM